jgi:hypothetical protein
MKSSSSFYGLRFPREPKGDGRVLEPNSVLQLSMLKLFKVFSRGFASEFQASPEAALVENPTRCVSMRGPSTIVKNYNGDSL